MRVYHTDYKHKTDYNIIQITHTRLPYMVVLLWSLLLLLSGRECSLGPLGEEVMCALVVLNKIWQNILEYLKKKIIK